MKQVSQSELEKLISIFQDAEKQLIETIINYKGVGTKVYSNTILKQLQAQLKRLEKETASYVGKAIPKEYKKALDEQYAYFKKNNLLMKPPQTFAQIHNDAIYAIAREMQYHIGQGLDSAGRRIIRYANKARDDALRQAGLSATGQKLATGSTVQQMQQNLIRKLMREGFLTVKYGSGKGAYQVRLDSYAQMVARSTSREAGNLARENQLKENGYDLVVMTTHYPTCEICAKFQGRVYSISGNDKRFPALFETAFSSGYRNVHPNCRHSIHAWIEELQSPDEVREALEKSNKSFDDERSNAEIGLYNKQQAENRKIRQDRYQYERYKATLGEDAPKSFRAFRELKKTGGDRWSKIQLDYKRRNELNENPDLKLPNAEKATAAESKFTEYLFNPENKKGYAKGVAFEKRLGYNKDNWSKLYSQILYRAQLYPVKKLQTDNFGIKYEQRIVIYGENNMPANVLVGWKVQGDRTWMTTCYIKEVD